MVKLLTKEEMEKLTTERLLAYKNKLMQVVEFDDEDSDRMTKSSPEWQSLYANVKSVLSTREHVE